MALNLKREIKSSDGKVHCRILTDGHILVFQNNYRIGKIQYQPEFVLPVHLWKQILREVSSLMIEAGIESPDSSDDLKRKLRGVIAQEMGSSFLDILEWAGAVATNRHRVKS